MGEAIGHVVELIRPEPAILFRQTLGLLVIVAGVGVGLFRDGYHLGTQCAQQRNLFNGLSFRNDNDSVITLGLANHRQSDPGVAGRSFNDRRAADQRAARFSLLDDPQRRAVLYRSARVHEFRFTQNFATSQFG
jgi:hypothetical protein